jgi:2-polyprenyl-3-methyl-5-hydroxy-6-metoxy-1,4-benzoquinol methylase
MVTGESTARKTGDAPLALVPDRCTVCQGRSVSIRFSGKGRGQASPEAYRCTAFGHRQHRAIWRCRECGLLFQFPVPSAADLEATYRAVEDPLYLAERENRYRTFRRVVAGIGPGAGRRLLDVGAYCGYFLDVAREAGFAAEGLELSAWAARHARGLGFAVHERTMAEHARGGARYDVVTAWDVVEHLCDPRAELAAAFSLLSPGGELRLSTIDAGSLAARILGSRWPWLMDMHLVYFDRRNVRAMLEGAGFRVTEIRDYTHTVSLGYLLDKLAASFPAASSALSAISRVVPSRLAVPVNAGDNMLVVAARP